MIDEARWLKEIKELVASAGVAYETLADQYENLSIVNERRPYMKTTLEHVASSWRAAQYALANLTERPQ